MHKQIKVFIGGLLYGLLGYIIFNLSLAALTSAIFGYTGSGLDSLGTIILIGKPLLFLAMTISACLVIWIGGRVLGRFGFDAPRYYALFGLILVWAFVQVVEPFVPVYLDIGVSVSLIGYLTNSLLLSLALVALFGGIAFVIIAAVRSRRSQPTAWLAGIAIGLVVVGSMLFTASAADRDAFYRQQSQKMSNETDIKQHGYLVYLPPKSSSWTQPMYLKISKDTSGMTQLEILPSNKVSAQKAAAQDFDRITYLSALDSGFDIEENENGACIKTGRPSLDRSDTCKIVFENSAMKVYLESAVNDYPDPDYYQFFVQRDKSLFYLGKVVDAEHRDTYIAHTLKFIRALEPATDSTLVKLSEAYQKQLPPGA